MNSDWDNNASAPPPPYASAMAGPSYDLPASESVDVKFREPVGYGNVDYHEEPSVTPGGLRLDKAVVQGNRLIIDFEKHACCPWETVGLDPDCKNYIPQELRDRGISGHTWCEWCEDLEKVQKKSPSITGCLCIFCFPGFLLQSILCATFCPISTNHPLKWLPCCYGDWHHGIDKWQRKVNKELNKKDMHVKLKTYKPHQKAPHSLAKAQRIAGKDHNYEIAMMEIALNAEESRKLQQEPWDNGVGDGCTSGIGRFL